jgi:hypothetical protein
VSLIVAASWILTIARSIPLRTGDRGVFASMAERLAAGDTLYVDVWDNKEPFFYLTLGLGRLISPYMDVVIEWAWLGASAVAMLMVLRSFDVPRPMAILVGLGVTPLILTGEVYYAGFSHLPGTAILLATYALLVRGRPALAGALLPVLAVFKVIMMPMAIVVIVIHLWRGHDARAIRRALVGIGVSAAAIVVLLVARGEFVGYVKLLISNVSYSQSSISVSYQVPVWKHIEPVFTSAAMATTAGIVLILALVAVLARDSARALWLTTLWTLVLAVVIIAATGLWPHHGQILYGPAVMAAVLLVAAFPQLQTVRTATIALVVAVTVVLSGAPSIRTLLDSGLSAPTRWRDLSRVADATQDLLSVANSGTYARLGMNTDDSHAQGLRNFTLRCYQFVQYPYDLTATLDGIPDCLPSVDYLIVDKGLVPVAGADTWNRYVTRSEAAIAAHFTCEQKDWGRLCRNAAL